MILDDKNESVEARQNLDGSGQDQHELQRSGTTLICREESNGGRIGKEIIREYMDANRFENGAK